MACVSRGCGVACWLDAYAEPAIGNRFMRSLIMSIINVMPLMMGQSASVVPEGKP